MLCLSILASWLADTSTQPFNFGVFGIGAIVFVILSTWLFLELRDHRSDNRTWRELVAEKDRVINDLQLARLEDAFKAAAAQQVLAERTLPLLDGTAKVLEASLAQAKATQAEKELDLRSAMSQMQQIVEEMRRTRES